MIQYEEEERQRTCKLCNRYIIELSNHEGAGGFSKREREGDGEQKARWNLRLDGDDDKMSLVVVFKC